MTQDVLVESVDRKVEEAGPVIERIAREVWELAEPSHEEVRSARLLTDVLEENGFAVTSRGTAAAIVKEIMAERGIPGTLRVYGCAAEETQVAKTYMDREGLFSDLDAALHWHPMPYAGMLNLRLAALDQVKVEFFGRTAHAGMEPWNGRSALHAAELFTHAVNVMREHLEPTARIHYDYERAGEATNIVPDHARLSVTVHDVDRTRVEKSTAWVRQIAEGASLATQTSSRVEVHFGLHDPLPNGPLAGRMQAHLERVEVPECNDEEQRFARECQGNLLKATQGTATEVLPLSDETTLGASSDIADASWNTSTMGCTLPAWPQGISAHTWPVVACGGTSKEPSTPPECSPGPVLRL